MKKILSFFAAILFAGSMMATDVAVTIHASSGDYYAKTHEWKNATQYDQVVLDDVISANLVGSGNNGKYYSDWRFYTEGSDAGSFSIDAIEGYALKSVTFTYTPSNSGALYMGEKKLTSKAAVELSGRKAVFQCKNTNTSTNGQVRLTAIAVTYEKSSGEEPPVETKYYMKNNWNAGSEWTWKEMSKSVTGAGLYVLENVVYGGTGVNFNTKTEDDGSSWVAQEAMEGDNAQIAAKDTVSFTLDPAKGAVIAKLVGKFQSGEEPPVMTPKFYITGNAALVGDELAWNPAAIPSYAEEYVFEKLTAAEYQLKITENGQWESAKGYDDLAVVPEGVSADKDRNIVFKLAKEQSDLKVSYAGGKIKIEGEFYVEEPPVVLDKYYMKNNWDGGEWTWLEMTPSDAAVNQYMLKDAIFGGTGVNYNKVADDKDATWVPLDEIIVDVDMKLEAKDTADFVLDVVAKTVSALNIRKFQSGAEPPIGTPLYYITGESLVGSWAPDALPVYKSLYEFESVKAGSYSFKITVDGTWATAKGYDDLTLKQDGLSKDNDGNICFTLAEDGPVAVLYTDKEFIVRGNFVVSEPPVVAGNIWKVVEETSVEAGATHLENDYLKISNAYASTLKPNVRTIAGEEFTHAIQVRVDAWPTSAEPRGKEKSGSTSIILTAKENIAITLYYNRQVVDGGGSDNDNKDVWVYDQASLDKPLTGEFVIDQILEGNSYLNATKKLSLEKGHTYTICAKGTTLQLHGIKFEAAEGPVEVKYYLKNNWDAGSEWTWKEMSKSVTAVGLFVLEDAIYGGTGVNFNTEEKDETATWVPEDQFVIAQELKLEPKDTANFLLNPKPAEGEAYISVVNIRKFQGGEPPVETPKFYITGNAALVGDELAWHPDAIPSMADEYVFKGLTAAEYQLKITENGQWESAKGYDDLEVVPAGVTTDNDRNINFKLAKEQSDLKVSYVGGKINIEGDFDVPEPPVNDKYYLKNNWGAGSEWTWKEMSKSVTAAGLFVLEDAIYGGTGVNFNTEEKDETATWVPEDQFVIAQELKLEPKDTANFLLNPKPAEGEAYISVVNIRKFQGGEPPVGTPLYYITGESLVGSWAPDALPVYQSLYEFESVKAGSYSFKITVDGTWNTAKGYDDLTLKQDGLSKDKDGNICFTLAEDGPVAVVYNEREFMVRGNFVVSEPPVGCNWDDIEWFNVGLGEGDENFNQFKICKQGELPNVVNIQTAPWADNNKGIYINFPSAEFTTISLPEGQYKVDGAGILLFLSAFSAQETEVKIEYKGEPVVFTVYNAKVDIPEVKYYMKNNWDAGSEWTWKEMTKMEGADGIYRLEQVIFGGTGVNYNTKADDEGAAWVELKDIVVPEGMELAAKDTADFQLEIAGPAPVVRALGIRKFQGGEPPIGTPLYYITGESLVGSWEPNALPVYKSLYEFESVKAGSYSFKITVDGTWATAKGYDDLTLKQDGLSKDNDGNICFTLAEDGPVSVLYTAEEFIVRGNFVVSEPPVVGDWDEIVFTEPVAANDLAADASFSNGESNFVLSIVDNKNKMAIDANGCRFGTAESYVTYSHRLKSGGTGSADNQMILSIPADGELRIAARTGSNGATDRNLVITQEEAELYNKVVQESDAVTVKEMNAAGEEIDAKVYPYISVAVKAGRVILSYPTGSLNFYAFAFKAGGSEPPVVEHTYSLVGPLSPAGWDEKSEKGDMTLVDGVYVFKRENVELVAGTKYEYKIVEDHSWAVAFPQSGNADFTVDKSGIYNVTFTLNAETKEYAAIPELIEEVVVVPSVAMHGNFLGSWADTENFEVAGDKQSASLKLTIAKGSYEFGMRIGGPNNWMSNGVEFTRENPSAVVEAGSGNLKLAADVEGEYTFTWIFERSTLVITFPEVGPVEDPTVAVIGSMTQWQEAIPFTLSEDKKSAKLVVDKIPVGDYEFKMLINGQYRSNGYEFHRDFHACAGISGNVEANMVLKVDAMGEFTFEWFFENDSLNIIFPEKSEIPDLYIKNNWGGAEEWSWKKMTYEVVEGNSVYYIMDVVFGGSGVNLNGKPSDEDASWIPVDRIQAFTPAQTKTELQALDTVMFVYYPAFETLVAVVTGPYNAPACEFEDGLYLVGSMNNWQKSKEYMLQINQSADGEEFMVELTLHTGDEFKVLWWAGCQEIAWIPGGTQNIIVDAAHAGLVRIYVRPAGNEAWPDKYWYYEVVIPENINNAEVNTKVVKMIENGQLFIQKGGKTYNVIGTLVK